MVAQVVHDDQLLDKQLELDGSDSLVEELVVVCFLVVEDDHMLLRFKFDSRIF